MAQDKEIKTKGELLKILKSLPIMNKRHRNERICGLIGHSRIQTACFGYYSCGRCGQQLGDTLGSVYSFANETVIIGHKCPKCKENYKKCTWKDKLYVKNPFKKEV